MRNSMATRVIALIGAIAGCRSTQVPPADSPTGPLTLLVAATTDVHGRLRGYDYYENAVDPIRGLTRAATIVDSLRTANPGRVILVDAGDLLQGNPLTYVAARRPIGPTHPVIDAMNAAGYDAMAIGNHEFNYGLPVLERALAGARFAALAANAYKPDGQPAYRRWVMVERQGVRVGIVGGTTPGSMIWDRDNLQGRLVIRDVVPDVRTAVAEARAAGADVVVTVLHSGLDEPSSYDTVSTGVPSENVSARVAREVAGIDLIVYGHSHREMADTVINGVMLMQPRNWATSVAVAELRVAPSGGRWRVISKRGQLIPPPLPTPLKRWGRRPRPGAPTRRA
jgi:2',3'-cyclic-nucleotide 2'-phosphodiesterase (5'-nucleotidase family)